MASEDDYRFSVEDGCVVLEIFGDSDDDDDDDENGETNEAVAEADQAMDDGGAESLATNGYSSDTSSLTVNSETMTNKSNCDPPSRHLSLEQQIKTEDDLELEMEVTDGKDFCDESEDQVNRENVICIQPQVNLASLPEESCDELTSDEMYLAGHDNVDEDLVATKQALSLNELFKQYRKAPEGNEADNCHHSRDSTEICSEKTQNVPESSENLDDLQLNTEDGVTEYLIQTTPDRMEIVQAKAVSVPDIPVMDPASVNIKQELVETGIKAGEIYDRKRPNLRRLPRINMAEDEYFDRKLKVIEKPSVTKYNSDRTNRQMNSFSKPLATKFSCDKAKRQMNSDKVQCDICEGWFAGTQSLSIHMRIHNNEKPYACPVCGWKSRTSSAHSVHIKLHSQNKQYVCTVCNMRFYTTSMLKSHSRVHSGERPYKCQYCSDSFAHSSTLKVHIRQHTKERPYVCTVCDKRFTQPTHLTTHLRTHTQEKPFQCKYCGKRMRQSSHLKIHLRIHTQERPYECDQCTANFMTKEHLVMHKRTHSGDHPYPCRICGEAFTQSSARKKHEKRHEEGEQYQCDICLVDCISPRALKRHKKNHGASDLRPKTEPKVEHVEEEEQEEQDEQEEQEEEIEEEELEEVVMKLEESVQELIPNRTPQLTKSRKKNPLQCDICFKIFARIPNVTRHKMEIHAGFKRSTWAHTFVRNNFDKVKKHLDYAYYK